MKFDIPEKCHIRWQAALAVLEDLQEDVTAPFDMRNYGDVKDWYKHDCGSVACFAGWMAVAPYCRALDLKIPNFAEEWLLGDYKGNQPYRLFNKLFSNNLTKATRAKTLAYLERTLKSIFKESTGKNLKAPLTFYVD